MRRPHCAFWVLAGLAVASLTAAAEPAAPAPADKPASKVRDKKPAAPRFMRVSRDEQKRPVSLETAVITFVPAGDKYPGVTIDLVGAIHVGDKEYYDALNKQMESYDVLLYELVAPEGTRIPKGGGKPRADHPIGALQGGMQEILALEHQLSRIDYTKKNFVHADMSPDEFAKSMSDRGEGFLQMMFRMMGQGMAMQGKGGGPSDIELLMALFASDRARQLKLIMAQQFEAVGIDGGMAALEGPEGSTIITERNKRCFAVMERELAKGHKKVGIFYGAGHFNDMEKRLIETYGFKRQGEKWLVAWDLTKATPKKK